MSGRGSTGELVTAGGLLALSVLAAWLALGMERPGGWATAPGLTPLAVSAGLFAAAASILVSVLRGRIRPAPGVAGISLRRIGAAAGITAVFYFVLPRLLPFEACAALFLAVMLRLFWRGASTTRCIGVAVAITLAIAALFAVGFEAPLPGRGSLVESLAYALGPDRG